MVKVKNTKNSIKRIDQSCQADELELEYNQIDNQAGTSNE